MTETLTQEKRPELNRSAVVSFSRRRRVRETLHRNEYTSTERSNCWYTSQELKQLRRMDRQEQKQRKRTFAADGSSEKDDDTGDSGCLRGLESSVSKKEIRYAAIDAVMDEQDRQFESHLDDQEQLAEIYKKKTKGSATLARLLAQSDQEYVGRLLKQEQQILFSSSSMYALLSSTAPQQQQRQKQERQQHLPSRHFQKEVSSRAA